MNIVYFCNFIGTSGGLDRIVIAKANYLSEKHQVYIVTTNQKDKEYFYPLDLGVRHIDYSDYNGSNNIWFSKNKFRKIMEEIKPDIIIAPTGKESLVLPFFDRKTPKIKEMHFTRNYRKIHHAAANIFLKTIIGLVDRIERRVYGMYDKVIPLTHEDDEEWKLGNTEVIYNFKTFEENMLPDYGSKVVMSAGRLEHEKGFDMLLAAWSKVCKTNDDWFLHIYGEGMLEKELSELAKKLQIGERVIFKGNVENIAKEYLKSSIYVMSSRHEGMPLTLIEAMECSLPIVSFACPSGPREMIDSGKNGFLAENENYVDLANKLLILIESEERRKNMGKKSKSKSKEFDKKFIMKQWERLFEDLIRSNK